MALDVLAVVNSLDLLYVSFRDKAKVVFELDDEKYDELEAIDSDKNCDEKVFDFELTDVLKELTSEVGEEDFEFEKEAGDNTDCERVDDANEESGDVFELFNEEESKPFTSLFPLDVI